MPDLVLNHVPGRVREDGTVRCLVCHLRIYQNTSKLDKAHKITDWAHIPYGSRTADFWFTCPGRFEKPVCEACGNPTAEDARPGWRHVCPATIEPPNWTFRGPRSNSSALYISLAREVGSLIRGEAHRLLCGGADSTGGLILSQLAFKHNFGPLDGVPPEYWPKGDPDPPKDLWDGPLAS